MSENKSLFVWNNRSYSATELVDLQEVPEYIATVQSALRFCLSQDSQWTLQTSGSTGAPKTLALSRAMIYGSARATLDAFELVPGSTAALVLPAKYIGGFIMVVRAFIGQLTLHLCEPRALPEVPEGLDFVSMTPAQFIALQEAGKPLKVKTLLLGGSALASRFDSASYQGVYLGYGMTETASHVALRPLGSPIYTAVGSTGFSVNTDECLCISAPCQMAEITYADFAKLDIRIGHVTQAEPYPEARVPAIKLWVDFGGDLGIKKSSAQLTAHYTPEALVGTQVLAVVNFPPSIV